MDFWNYTHCSLVDGPYLKDIMKMEQYRGADKFLARSGRKQAAATKL